MSDNRCSSSKQGKVQHACKVREEIEIIDTADIYMNDILDAMFL